ncbi:MAG: hypothetical protein ACYCSF_11935 [Acidimicrobiales bacterium]
MLHKSAFLYRLASLAAVGMSLGACAAARSEPAKFYVRPQSFEPGATGSSAARPDVARRVPSRPVDRARAGRVVQAVSSPSAVAEAWVSSEEAFYRAGRLGDPEYAPLISSFASSSPVLAHVVSWLTALYDAGVVAPFSYRLGNVHVTRITTRTATLTGCAYDAGSTYRVSGAPAPPGLGGGAGLTASVVTLRRAAGRWLVWSAESSSPTSPKEKGPCHGF